MGRKRMLLFLTLIMILCSGCSLMVSVKKDPLPEETIEAFEAAINEMDVDAMMECMDSKAVKAMTTGMDVLMKVAGGLTGIDIPVSAEDLLSLMPLMQGINQAYGDMEYPQVDLQVTETYIKGEKATVYFTEANSGEHAVINMELQDGKWVMIMDLKVIEPEDADRVIIAGQNESETKDSEEKKTASGVLEIAGDLDLGEAVKSMSALDIFSQEKIADLLRALLNLKKE